MNRTNIPPSEAYGQLGTRSAPPRRRGPARPPAARGDRWECRTGTARGSRTATGRSPAPSPASSSPPRPSRALQKVELAARGQRGAGEHDRVAGGRTAARAAAGARSSGTAESCTFWPRAVRSIQRTVGGPPAAGPQRPVEPVRDGVQPPEHPAQLAEQLRPRRSVSSAWASRSAIVSTASRSARNARQRRVQLERQALVPDRIHRRSRRPDAAGPPATSASRSYSRRNMRVAGAPRVGQRREQPLLQQIQARPAQQVAAARELVRAASAPGPGRSARSAPAAAAPPGWSPARPGGWRRRPRGGGPRPAPAAGRAAAPRRPASCPCACRTERSAASR